MTNTLLSVVQDVHVRVGIDMPTIVVNGSPAVRQTFKLLLESARDMMRRHDWQALERVATFTSTAVELQAVVTTAWPMFTRIKKNTFINITKKRRMIPIDATQHATLTLRGTTGDLPFYRIRGNELLLPGNTDDGDSCQFEYMSNSWAVSSDGTTYLSVPTDDTDVLLLDDEALVLGTKWRWKKEAGLAYGEDFVDYEKRIQELTGSDQENRTLQIGSRGVLTGAGHPAFLSEMYAELQIPTS